MNKYKDKQYLYKLTFPNEMVYIGVAFDVNERWANNGFHYRTQRVYQYIQEFGWNNIKREVLLYIPYSASEWIKNNDTIHRLERELIRAYGDRCYNDVANKIYHEELAQRNRERGMYEPKVLWTIGGVTKAAKDWCAERGVTYTRAKRIIDKYGVSPEQALSLPPIPGNMTRRAEEYWRSQGFDCFNSCRA